MVLKPLSLSYQLWGATLSSDANMCLIWGANNILPFSIFPFVFQTRFVVGQLSRSMHPLAGSLPEQRWSSREVSLPALLRRSVVQVHLLGQQLQVRVTPGPIILSPSSSSLPFDLRMRLGIHLRHFLIIYYTQEARHEEV